MESKVVGFAGWRWRLALVTIMIAGLPMMLECADALAQSAKGEAVRARARADYESYGLSLGPLIKAGVQSPNQRFGSSFEAFARAELDLSHESNIFRTSDSEVSSAIANLRPALALRSDWDNHGLNLVLSGEARRVVEQTTEDSDDATLRLSGRIDIDDGTTLDGFTEFARLHSSRGADDDPGSALEPLTYYKQAAGFTFAEGINDRLAYGLEGTFTRYRYDPKNGVANDDLDRDLLRLAGRARLSGVGAFDYVVQPEFEQVDYRLSEPTDSDSTLYALSAGIEWDKSALTAFEGRIGVSHRTSADSSVSDQTDLRLQVNGLWNITPLITLTGEAKIANEDSQETGASSKSVAAFKLGIDYDLLDNLILGFSLQSREETFNGIGRTDELFEVGLSADYLINENYFLRTELRHEDQSSDVAGENYDNTTFLLRFGAKICCLTDGGVIDAFR